MKKLNFFFALLFFITVAKAQDIPQLVVQKGNSGEISCISYSPDGRKILALCTAEGTMKIWETASGRLLNTIASHATKAAYSNDGNYMLVEETGLTKVYDATADTILYTVKNSGHSFPSVLLANKGLWLVAAGLDSFVRIKNIKDGSDVQTIPTRHTKVLQAVLSPDNTHLLIISTDTSASMIDISNNSYYELEFPAKTPLQCKFSNTGKYVAVKWCRYYDYDHERKDPYDIKTVVIETVNGKQIGIYDSVFAFSPDDTRMLVSKRPDYIVRSNGIYDSISEVSIAGDSVLFRRNVSSVGYNKAASYSDNGNFFVLWSSLSMQVFNSQSHSLILKYPTSEQDSLIGLLSASNNLRYDNMVGLHSLTISSDSKSIVFGTDIGKIIELSTAGSRIKLYEDPFNAITDAQFVPMHSYIFTRSIDNYGIIWNLKDASMKYMQDLTLQSFGENDFTFLPQFRKVDFNTDGSFFTTTTPVGITLRKTEGLTKISSMETFGSSANYFAISPDAKFICRVDREGDTPTKNVTVSAIGSSGHLSTLYTLPFSSFFPVINTTVFSFPVQETIVPEVEDISFKDSRHIVVRFDGQLDKRSPFKIKTKQMKNGLSLLGIDPCYKDNSSPEITNFHYSFSALLHAYIVCTDNKIYRVNPVTGSIEKISTVLLSNPHLVDNLEFDPQAKYAFYKNESDKKIYAVEVASGKPVYFLKGNDSAFSNISFSPDAQYFITLSDDKSSATIWSLATGEAIFSFTDNTTRFVNAVYSADSRYILCCAQNGSYEKREAATGKLIYTFFLFKDYDYAIVLPEGYYYSSSRSDVKYLNFRLKNKLYNFSQFDMQFNRPDKVLEALGSTDTALISAYHKIWVKRISESGFTEPDFVNNSIHVPDVSLLNGKALPEISTEKKVPLYFMLSDSLYKITAYNIYINDVPLNGIKGIRLQTPANNIRLGQNVSLDSGINKIEIDCINEKGEESHKETVYITYQPAEPEASKTWFIGIGINHYSQHGYLPNLMYCVKDIRDLAASFKQKYNSIEIDTLMNEDATKQNILALKKTLMQTGVDDRVIISFNGHGMSFHDEFYFATPSCNPQSPDADGISYTDMQNLLDSIPARKKLLLIDACHSGEADADNISSGIVANGITYTTGDTKDNTPQGNNSVQIIAVKADTTNQKVFNLYGMMKTAFIDLRKNNGAVVIAASQSNQQAHETRGFENGLFTHCVLKQLGNATLNVSNLLIKINEDMKNETKQQQSVSRQELSESDWALW